VKYKKIKKIGDDPHALFITVIQEDIMSPSSNDYKRIPFQCTVNKQWEDNKLQTEANFMVPKDSRLVIENISARIECPIDQEIIYITIGARVFNKATGQPEVVGHSIYVPKTGSTKDGVATYSGGQQVRIYADPGTTVDIVVTKNSMHCPTLPPSIVTIVSISGYLLPPDSPSLAP
jgi:hypothetical protein